MGFRRCFTLSVDVLSCNIKANSGGEEGSGRCASTLDDEESSSESKLQSIGVSLLDVVGVPLGEEAGDEPVEPDAPSGYE